MCCALMTGWLHHLDQQHWQGQMAASAGISFQSLTQMHVKFGCCQGCAAQVSLPQRASCQCNVDSWLPRAGCRRMHLSCWRPDGYSVAMRSHQAFPTSHT